MQLQETAMKKICIIQTEIDRSKLEREREIEIYGIPFAFRPQGFLLACVHTFPLSSFLPMHSARDIPARTAFQLEFSTCSP